MSDPYNLRRFADAQDPVFERVRQELESGRKTSHWMWFVFPQLAGLGHSSMARLYAISSKEEAEAYLRHPILGARLRECAQWVNRVEGRSIEQILGPPDDLKFRSCMTLFARVDPGEPVFQEALRKYFGGEPDPLTLDRL
jgi:uncharacterized protein (DUF1810 family)